MSRMATATDPITGEFFPLNVDDPCGGHATAAYTLEVFHTLALRHRITFWELLDMLKIATLGADALEPDFNDPLSELEQLRRHAVRDAWVLEGPCSLADAVAVLCPVRRYFELLAEHHPNPLNVTERPVRTGRGAQEMRVRGVSQYGSAMGNHVTDGGRKLRGASERVQGARLPGQLSVPLGNALARLPAIESPHRPGRPHPAR